MASWDMLEKQFSMLWSARVTSLKNLCRRSASSYSRMYLHAGHTTLEERCFNTESELGDNCTQNAIEVLASNTTSDWITSKVFNVIQSYDALHSYLHTNQSFSFVPF